MEDAIMQHIPKYLNEFQVSEITGIALSTLRNQRFQRRGIPYSKLGGGKSVRYSLEDVIGYMTESRVETIR
jgi:phage terminase Nu1 subunit (DNA packaging protein)